MAIGFVQSKAGASGSSVSSHSITLDSAPTAGNVLIAAAAFFGTATSPGVPAAMDVDAGVSWALGSAELQGGSNTCLLTAFGRVRSGASATISISTAQAGGIALAVYEFSGLSTELDQFAINSGNGTVLDTGTTGTTATANQLWFAAFSHRATSGGTFSGQTNSFTGLAQAKSTLATTSDRSVAIAYKIVSATGTANCAINVTPTGVWTAQILTFKETASSGGGATGSRGRIVNG